MFETRARCAGCGSKEYRELFSAPFHSGTVAEFLSSFYKGRLDPSILSGQPYSIVECNTCQLVFQQHILNNHGMNLLYSEWISAQESLKKRRTGKAKQFRKYAAEAELLGRMIDKHNHDISVVEFGMGWGYWSRMAAAFNYQVVGIELSQERIQHAQSLGVPSVANIGDISAASVDFIYANQVFEHIANPLETLKELTTLLCDGGVIHIRVPDGANLAAQLKENGWSPSLEAIHPLEHINAFSRSSLVKLASSAGLTEIRAPLRISARSVGNVWLSIVREYRDRYKEPHIYFTKA